ncbi:hypothetical protein ABH19_00745 [Leptospirillum sp. Group II 'CF-1']|nr:hypothetical protein ABH19_00745 [Leptospirillum sp. Group II 'CF-1']
MLCTFIFDGGDDLGPDPGDGVHRPGLSDRESFCHNGLYRTRVSVNILQSLFSSACLSRFSRRVFWTLLGSCVALSLESCQPIKLLPTIPDRKADLTFLSMMSADRSGTGVLNVRTCTPRYLEASFRWPKETSRSLTIQTAWPPGFNPNQGRAVVPFSARYSHPDGQGGTAIIPLTGFVLFRNLATCQIERAVFAATSDPAVIEPALYILDVKGLGRKGPWVPRTILFTGYRTLLNESVEIVGPVPFMRRGKRLREPVILFNGVPQKNRSLRGVDPPDFRNRLSLDLWIQGKPFHVHAKGDGEDGIFVVRNRNVRGLGVLIPRVQPPYHYPDKKYRFVLGGGLLVDGPVAMAGTIQFSRKTMDFSLEAQMNQAGSVLDHFRYYGHYRTGDGTRFRLPGEVDLEMDFNHRTMSLVLLPDSNNRTYWIASVDQNILGIMEPVSAGGSVVP